MEDFVTWQVDDLKSYLKTRGIWSYLYRKNDLVRFCQLAEELQLENIDGESDYLNSYAARRTVNGNVLCDLGQFQNWETNLHILPGIEHCDVLIYLLNTCGWKVDRLKSYRKDNGYRLYSAGHIDDVCIASIPNSSDHKYIKATCLPETRQNADPYGVWIIVTTSGTVMSGGCSCVVDNGTCKHCVALLFSVTDFCERHQDRHTLVGTDVDCKWDKPRTKSEPMEINYIDVRLDQSVDLPRKPTVDGYTPIRVLNYSTKREVEKRVYSLCKTNNSVLLQCLDPPSDDSDTELDINPLTLNDIAELVKNSGDPLTNLLTKIKSFHDKDVISKIEEITRGQSENPDWIMYRKGRITASNFSAILSFGFSDNPINYILERLMNNRPCIATSAMKYGIDNEPIARCLYTQQYLKAHMHATVKQCGLFIDASGPILGASPDGIVSCTCCGSGLLEIKCSAKFQNTSARAACNDDSYHLYIDENDKIRLKNTSPWFVQIQGQMGVCGVHWCDFVFYTKKNFIIERIYFDQNLYSDIVKKSKRFFEKYVVNALISEA